jgi:tRNA U34 5-carboxymethylaminomethyl modifying GTPase MnmE/TrmE
MSSSTEDFGLLLDSPALPRRLELSRCLDEAATLGADVDACAVLRQKLRELTFNLVVAGQFKRGKSSLLNALLGDELLPVGVIPLTSVVTLIRDGPMKAATVELEDGREQSIPVDDLSSYVTERGNPHNVLAVRQVVIEHPSSWLASGVRLVDTPGIGSVYEHNTDVAQKYLPNADAVLFIASVDQPLSRAELDFLQSIRQYAEKIFCVLNKIDHLNEEELQDSIDFVRDQLRANLNFEVPLFAVSARLALQARKQSNAHVLIRSGFPAFEHSLREFLARDKEEVLLRSIARSLLRLLSQARFAHELEAKVLTTPQAQLETNLAAFARKRTDVERSSADHLVLLEVDAKTLLDNHIAQVLEEFKVSEQQRMSAAVAQWYAELSALPLRKLQPALEKRLFAEIRLAYDSWLARQDISLTHAFSAMCERAWQSLQSAVDELIRYSSELFTVSFEPIAADSQWSLDSRFYYKFWYEPTSLRLLSGSLVLMLPKALAGSLLVRRTSIQAAELIDSQAGRIRHDLQERLKASVRDAQRRISATTNSILARIEAAIDGGARIRHQSASHVQERTRELTARIDGITVLQRRVETLCG